MKNKALKNPNTIATNIMIATTLINLSLTIVHLTIVLLYDKS